MNDDWIERVHMRLGGVLIVDDERPGTTTLATSNEWVVLGAHMKHRGYLVVYDRRPGTR